MEPIRSSQQSVNLTSFRDIIILQSLYAVGSKMSLPFCSADSKKAVGSQRLSGQKQNKHDKLREKDIEIHGEI